MNFIDRQEVVAFSDEEMESSGDEGSKFDLPPAKSGNNQQFSFSSNF